MKQTKKLSRKVISYVLALAMVLSTMTGIVPGMSLKVYAAPTETLLTTITPTGIDTYSESTAGVVNVTLSGISRYSNGLGWCNGGTVTVTQKEGYTITKCRFIARRGAVDDTEAPFSIDVGYAMYVSKVEVYGYQTSSKTAQTVTPPTAATDLTYKKDQAQALLTSGASVTTGNTATGSVQYKVGADGTWSTEIPKKTNAGTYNVYYKVSENETYAEYAPTEPISVTIAKANPETPTGITAKYGDDTGKIKLPEGWTWNDWHYFGTVGTDTVKADFAGNDNYNAKTGVDITVAVDKADVAISYEKTEVSVEYGAEFGKNEITNPGDAEPTFTSSKESVATVSNTGYVTIKGIGETTITATIEDNAHYHYTTTEASYKLTVNPISTVIRTAPTADEITYGQKLSKSTLTGGEAVSHGRSVAGTFAWKEPDLVPNASESGEYEVVFIPTDTTNYAESTCNVKVKVNKAAAPATKESLSPEQKPAAKNADDLVYTGESIELVTAPANPLGGYKVQYSKDNGTTWTDTIPTETNVDTYTVKVKYVSDNYENIDLDDITVEITPVSKEQLENAVAAASKYLDTIKDNDDYSSVTSDLQNAINAANTTLQIENPTANQIGQAVKAIKDAKAAAEKAVKAIDDEKAAQAVIDKINGLNPAADITPSDRADIEAARKAYDDLTDDQKAKLAELDPNAVATLEVAEKALDTAEKAAFDDEKEAEKKAADALAADGDSDASKKLIEDAKKAIDELAYDETKSLDENKAALAAIVSKLESDLTDNREAEKKEAADTEAAKKVIDAINALPASNKVATTDKEAIEAARKAYDALTEDQKAKVPVETLKKLEEAEAALEAVEKDEADQAAADAVAEKINALPASDKIATTDKEAIEAARKAYDALTEDQKAKVPAETLKKLEDAEKALADAEKNTSDDDKKDEEKPDYKNEWVDGQWYGADGNTEYKAKGSWKQNDKGWWYEDTDGWYPVSQWQMIDGKWYYFTADGYMDYSEYRDGCWLGSDGAWDETYSGGHWMQDSTGWWYVDSTGWYPVNRYLWVDGVLYWFNANGYWE